MLASGIATNTGAANSGEGIISVGRLKVRYLVFAGHTAPESVRAQLDAVAQDALRVAVAALRPIWSTGDGGVWLIRRLEVEVDVGAACEPGDLARRWAMPLARRLADTLCAGAGDVGLEDAVYFKSRAAYLSHFLADLASGSAWGRW